MFIVKNIVEKILKVDMCITVTEVHDIVWETGMKTIPKKEMQKSKMAV